MIFALVALAVVAFASVIVAAAHSRRVNGETGETINSLLALVEDGDAYLAAAEAEIATLKADAAPTEWLESVMTKRITVHLTNDLTIEGSLVSRMDDGVVLRAAKLIGDGAQQGTALVGDLWIASDKVLMAQLDT